MFRGLLFLLLVLVCWCFWPVTAGGFVIDDYVFIAQSRMVDAPWAAFWSNHFYEPLYFRPIGVTIWWIATRLFDLNYMAHSVINLVLHGANVILVALLVRALTERIAAAMAAAAVFALLPFSFAAILWPSNRFDLLSVLFLLLTAIACNRFLRNGHPLTWLAAGGAALAACLSKELAFPIATATAFLCLVVTPSAPWQRRVGLFAMLGGAITLAFVWRHAMLPMPYAAASNDVMAMLWRGAAAWTEALPKLFAHSTNHDSFANFAIVTALLAIAFAAATALFFPRRARHHWNHSPVRALFGATVILAVSALSQWPLASNFAPMLDGGALGTTTYARFFYAPAAALAILIGLVVTHARLVRSVATLLTLCGITIGLQTRATADAFARWTQEKIEPVSLAASRVVDAVSRDAASPCVVVFLDTQANNNPWFRMFSDVTVKALTTRPETTWRCAVLTESTPWIFISPANQALAEIGLSPIIVDAKGTLKPDYAWGGVRYRYRTMVGDARQLTNAKFFRWNGREFVDITDDVRTGKYAVKTHGWGF